MRKGVKRPSILSNFNKEKGRGRDGASSTVGSPYWGRSKTIIY